MYTISPNKGMQKAGRNPADRPCVVLVSVLVKSLSNNRSVADACKALRTHLICLPPSNSSTLLSAQNPRGAKLN